MYNIENIFFFFRDKLFNQKDYPQVLGPHT
jgi:hypothetical protein